MKNLFIDTSSSYVTIAIVKDDVILEKFYDQITDDMSSKIFPIIDELFSKVDFEIKDIEKVYVVNGPGSFTGIRIGVTIAKVLASSLNIKICPISSLEYMVSGFNDDSIALIDARRGFVYAGGYDLNLNNIFNDTYIEFSKIDLNKFKNIVSYDNLDNLTAKPNPDIIKAIKKHQDDEVLPHSLKPNYLKLTEAEMNKQGALNG